MSLSKVCDIFAKRVFLVSILKFTENKIYIFLQTVPYSHQIVRYFRLTRSPDRIQHPTSAETCMWGKQSAAMLAAKRLAGVAPEVNLRECISHMPPPSPNKAAHSGFETPEVQNRGISGTTKRTYVFQKLKKKTTTKNSELVLVGKPLSERTFTFEVCGREVHINLRYKIFYWIW